MKVDDLISFNSRYSEDVAIDCFKQSY